MLTVPPSRPARRAAPRLSRFSSRVLTGLAKKTRYADPALAEQWPAIAGEDLAALTRPGRLTGGRRDRTLELHVASGAAAAKAQMAADGLIQRLNAYLGPGTVSRIAVLQSARGPAPQGLAAPAAPPQDRDDSPLGAALANFRAAVARRRGE